MEISVFVLILLLGFQTEHSLAEREGRLLNLPRPIPINVAQQEVLRKPFNPNARIVLKHGDTAAAPEQDPN